MLPTRSFVRELAETVIIAILLALVIRGFVIESFLVQGQSMEPTLLNGERLWVNKFIYRFRPPQRGDIIVFRYPFNPDRDFIKRVIATGGETVEIRDGIVYVDGEPVDEPYIPVPGHSDYARQRVPAGFIFVLGDNRSNSEDSRFFGFVPFRNVKGKAFLVYWPVTRLKIPR